MFLKMKQKKYLKQAFVVADAVIALENKYASLSDDELREKTNYFLKKIENGATKEDIIVDAFATAREAASRTIGLKAYRVQIAGAALIARGYIAEMQTGEGKTLTEVMPTYLMSLFGNGVHVVTVNDYLAKRDCEWMGPAYALLGVSANYVISTSSKEERKVGYASDITYVTNHEIAFDYLRDNMATKVSDIVLDSRFGFAIIDEADSILIDEARTPFIVSKKNNEREHLFALSEQLVRTMVRGEDIKELGKMDYILGNDNNDTIGDYQVDEKNKCVLLTKNGTLKTEKFFNCGFLSDPKNSDILYCVLTSLKAHEIMKREKDYIVDKGQVYSVDEFTGRIQKGRRYTNGLHQAIEAKENCEIKAEQMTTATVTFQTLFNMYKDKAGMTGTAMTEAKELMEIYKLVPVAVPTNVPTKREDHPDAIYGSCKDRDNAVLELVKESMETGRPILVGTPSVEAAERISALFTKNGVKHNVLSAKNHELEAEIIANAGQKGAITVATNMAGRGTDIKLAPEVQDEGLLVIGTARHDSRRIDNQLRGRSGRQGDHGDTIFMLSTDDDLIRIFGGNAMKRVVDTLNTSAGIPLSHPLLAKELNMAQHSVESQNFETRKQLYEYDTIVANQCNIIYKLRDEALKGGISKEIPETIADTVDFWVTNSIVNSELNMEKFKTYVGMVESLRNFEKEENEDIDDFANRLCKFITETWRNRRNEFDTDEQFEEFCSVVFLNSLDNFWAYHINAMTELRKNISLSSYAQKDPLVEYKTTGGEMFAKMLNDFKPDVVIKLLLAQIIKQVAPTETIEDIDENEVSTIDEEIVSNENTIEDTNIESFVEDIEIPFVPDNKE